MNQSHTKKLIRKSLFNSEYSTEASTNLVSQSPSLTFLYPISAGVLENQNEMYICMTNDTSLESSCALLLRICEKIANLQKLNFLSQNPVI